MPTIDYLRHQIEVVLAVNLAAVLGTIETRPLLVLTPPADTSWNDFGHNLWTDAVLLQPDGRRHSFDAMMVFGAEGRSAAYIRSTVAQRTWIHAQELPTPFCSVMVQESSYRDLMHELDFDLGISVLEAMGDIVLLQALGSEDPRLLLIDQESFHFSALRQERTWTALRRARRHLRRDPAPSVAEAANSFGMRAQLPSSAEPCIIDFDLTPDRLMRDRFIVLIGQNGVGKTQLMLSLLDGLRTKPVSHFAFAPETIRFAAVRQGRLRVGRPEFTRVVLFSSTLSDPYPKEIAPWDGLDYQYFSIIGQTAGVDRNDALTLALLDCMRDDMRTRFAEPVVAEDDDEDAFAAPNDRMALLKAILDPLGLLSRIYIPLKEDAPVDINGALPFEGQRYHPFRVPGAEQRRLRFFQAIDLSKPPILFGSDLSPRSLSSGETAMLRFAAQMVSSVEHGTLFLFDEPETHLHPNYVSHFVEILHGLLSSTGSVAVAATHSAYLVREVPSNRVRVLRAAEGKIEVEEPRLQTFGASIDRISDAVFYNSDIQHQYQETLAKWVGTLHPNISIEQVAAEYGPTMNTETLSLVHRMLRDGVKKD